MRVHVREHAHSCSPSSYELYLTPKDIHVHIPHVMSCIMQLKHVLQCIIYMSPIADLCLQSDDIVMETFYHKSGQIYTCVYQGGQRFYMDSWETQVMTSLTLAIACRRLATDCAKSISDLWSYGRCTGQATYVLPPPP